MNISVKKMATSAFAGWVLIGVLAAYFLLPLKKHLKYGIDLVGGTYITLEVQTHKAVEDEYKRIARYLPDIFKKANITAPSSTQTNLDSLVLTFASPFTAQEAASLLKKEEPKTTQSVQDNVVTIKFTANEVKRIKQDAVKGNLDVLDSRLRKLAVEEISIAQKGENNIIVELPDVDDPQQAKAMIGTPAVLEFKIVESAKSSEDEILDEFDGQLPDDMMIAPGRDERDGSGKNFYLLSKYADVTGKLLKDARSGFGGKSGSQLVVHFQFTPDGGRQFYDLTSKNVNRPLAILLDGVVISAPNINEPIGAQGQISGHFTPSQVNELAALLKSGAFVAPVTFEEERRIGPTLGEESIRRGLLSCLVGLGLLLFFSLFYYKVAGLFAFFTLLYNLLLLLFLLSRMKATLTLPGIAGMVLTVGMAIDASVLIYERIKEELLTGISFRNAVKAGFSDAMVVILDANITTFIVGVVLYKFGTGPIQGFAVTMMIGIITTLITGLFFLRSLFTFFLDSLGVQDIKI